MPKQITNVILYDLQEAAELLGITERTLRTYIKQGKIVHKRIGKKYYITQENINKFITH